MTILKILTAAALLTLGVPSFAEETTGEAVKAEAHDAKRAIKKKGHRVAEAVCAESDAECLAKKAKNRGVEGKDYVKDKSKEVKDKVD